jgi:hypothetical protein
VRHILNEERRQHVTALRRLTQATTPPELPPPHSGNGGLPRNAVAFKSGSAIEGQYSQGGLGRGIDQMGESVEPNERSDASQKVRWNVFQYTKISNRSSSNC